MKGHYNRAHYNQAGRFEGYVTDPTMTPDEMDAGNGDRQLGVFTFTPPPQAEPGELERERARLLYLVDGPDGSAVFKGKHVQRSMLPVYDVTLENGTVWATFKGKDYDGRTLSYRWYARDCVVMTVLPVPT